MDTNQENAQKKLYVKPQVTEVRLVAGEAVLATCKNGPSTFSECQPIPESCGTASAHS